MAQMAQDESWELQLAAEGSALGPDARVAFAQRFALAPSVAAKRAAVAAALAPSSPDLVFYEALCALLEAQRLLERQGAADADGEADGESARALARSDGLLRAAERALERAGSAKKLARLRQRRLALELELRRRAGAKPEQLAEVGGRLAAAMDIKLSDPVPTDAGVADAYPSELDDRLVSTAALIDATWEQLKREPTISDAKTLIGDLRSHPREIIFTRLVKADEAELPAEKRWSLVELFLDDFAPEFTSIPGLVDVVMEDIEREDQSPINRGFGFRRVHKRMPLSQLIECLQRAPDLFRNNIPFATRGLKLIRTLTECEVEGSEEILSRGSATSLRTKLSGVQQSIDFLDHFSSALIKKRLTVRLEELDLRQALYYTEPDTVDALLKAIVEYAKLVGYIACSASESVSTYHDLAIRAGVSKLQNDNAVKSAISLLFSSMIDSSSVFDALSGYVGTQWLSTQQAIAMIKNGKGDLATWIEKLPQKGKELDNDTSTATPDIAFCQYNPTYFAPQDPLRIHVRVKNVQSLTAHLYEIKTEEYYSRLRHEVRGDVCLDGLLPNEEIVLDLSHLTKWQEARVPIEFLRRGDRGGGDVKSKRGVYVVEILEKGVTCRAILRRGFLRYVERLTTRGHELVVLDECGAIVRDSRAVLLRLDNLGQPGWEYGSDDEGVIVIPFRDTRGGSGQYGQCGLMLSDGTFCSLNRSFEHHYGWFTMNANMHIDSEQLLPGSRANLLTRLVISCGGSIPRQVELGPLTDIELTVVFELRNNDGDAVASGKTYTEQFGSVEEFFQASLTFTIPLDCVSLTVHLTAQVLSAKDIGGTGSPYRGRLSDKKSFAVQHISRHNTVWTPHLVRKPTNSTDAVNNGYSVLFLGHNGERIPDIVAQFRFRNYSFAKAINVTLRGDGNGEVRLGELKGIIKLTVTSPTSKSNKSKWKWQFPNTQTQQSLTTVHCAVKETVEIPIPPTYSAEVDQWLSDGVIGIFQVIRLSEEGSTICEPMTNNVGGASLLGIRNRDNNAIGVSVTMENPGTFAIVVRPLALKCIVKVFGSKRELAPLGVDALIQSSNVFLSTLRTPLMIASQRVVWNSVASSDTNATKCTSSTATLEVELRNAVPGSTQIVVYAKRFVDPWDSRVEKALESLKSGGTPFASGSSGCMLMTTEFSTKLFENRYMKARKLGDEYAYILRRRALLAASGADGGIYPVLSGPYTASKPTLIHNPRVVSESNMEVVVVADGDDVVEMKTQDKKSSASVTANASTTQKSHAEHSIGFLRAGSEALFLSAANTDGITSIELPIEFESCFGDLDVVTLVIDHSSGQHAVSTTFLDSYPALEKGSLRDLRLTSKDSLQLDQHFLQTINHEWVRGDEERVLDVMPASPIGIYQTLDDVLGLWMPASGGFRQSTVQTLKRWPKMTTAEKTTFYFAKPTFRDRDVGDEFNFFLFKKDRAFFDEIVRPQIQSKVGKTLLDYCMLEDVETLQRFYLSPSMCNKLQPIERLIAAATIAIATPTAPLDWISRICDVTIYNIRERIRKGWDDKSLRQMFETVLSHGGAMPPWVRHRRAHCQSNIKAAGAAVPGVRIEAVVASDLESIDEDFDVRSIPSDDEDEDKPELTKKRVLSNWNPDKAYIRAGKVRRVEEYRTYKNSGVSGANEYWVEYAKYLANGYSTKQRFVSSLIPEALTSFFEGLLAIAVLDLEIDCPRIEPQQLSGNRVRVVSASDMLLYYRNLIPVEVVTPSTSELIVTQKYLLGYPKRRTPRGYMPEPVNGEFVVHRIYSCTVRVSNVGDQNAQAIDVLMQIPQGAIPLGKSSFYLKGEMTSVSSQGSSDFTYSFYFPEAGEFEHYPAHVSMDGKVVAWAGSSSNGVSNTIANRLRVVVTPTETKLTSWSDICARGTLEDISQYILTSESGSDISFDPLLWRCEDAAFFTGLTAFLRQSMRFSPKVWKYSLLHGDEQGIGEFLQSSASFAQTIGEGVVTTLVDTSLLYKCDSLFDTFNFNHTEFGPFLNQRAHPITGTIAVGGSSDAKVAGTSINTIGERIPNEPTRQYFLDLCLRLGMYANLTAQHMFVLTYYLVLFNWTREALEVFSRLEGLSDAERNDINGSVQFDYLRGYIDLVREDTATSGIKFTVTREVVQKHLLHPNPRWSERFKKLKEVLDEHDAFELQKLHRLNRMGVSDAMDDESGGVLVGHASTDDNDEAVENPVARPQVRLDATVSGSTIRVTSQCLRAVEVMFYPIDVERMFSTDPFNTFADGSSGSGMSTVTGGISSASSPSKSSSSSSSAMLIEPRQRMVVELLDSSSSVDDETGLITRSVSIPRDLASTQMMVRVCEPSSGGRTIESVAPHVEVTRAYFNSRLHVTPMPQLGLVQVLHAGSPVRSCYVKVYARVSGGVSGTGSGAKSKLVAEFYKDGYTDLLGKFDYVGINGDLIEKVSAFSLLVSHPQFGASVVQVSPPVLASTTGDYSHKEAVERLLY